VSDTLGSLVDKLITNNSKLWYCQDVVHKAAAAGEGLDADTVAKLHSLNLTRNRLMSEIDKTLANAVKTGVAEVDPHIKIY
jgi:hypothetical protein